MHQPRSRSLFHGFNQPAALSKMNELPQFGYFARCGQLTVIGRRWTVFTPGADLVNPLIWLSTSI